MVSLRLQSIAVIIIWIYATLIESGGKPITNKSILKLSKLHAKAEKKDN